MLLGIVPDGGGVPVVRNRQNRYEGVPAVIDKDLTSALLADEIGADALIVLARGSSGICEAIFV